MTAAHQEPKPSLAAYVSMALSYRDKIARMLLLGTAIAAVALVLAGCVRVVSGRALMAGPKLGEPVKIGRAHV